MCVCCVRVCTLTAAPAELRLRPANAGSSCGSASASFCLTPSNSRRSVRIVSPMACRCSSLRCSWSLWWGTGGGGAGAHSRRAGSGVGRDMCERCGGQARQWQRQRMQG